MKTSVELEWDAAWNLVWERDVPWCPSGRVWFDLESHTLTWEECDDPRQPPEGPQPAEVAAAPERYGEIPRLTHGEHHVVFGEFRETLPLEVRKLCNDASIGGFLEDLQRHPDVEVAQEYTEGWHDYHDQALQEEAAEWLADRGLRVIWK